MSTKYYVKVSNLSPETSEEKLHDFFTFCGKIESIEYKGTDGVSTVYFEKPSAVTTALMLNDGTLDGAKISVKSDEVHPDEDREESQTNGTPLTQSDKPRAGIAAEYLAKGYTLSDQILQRAIELDKQKGISQRFLSYFQQIDTTVGAKALGPDQTVSGKLQATLTSATERAREIDQQKGFLKSMHDYYSNAISSPFGQKVREFYMNTEKQLKDIHEEARRIADTHKTTPPTTGGSASEWSGSEQPVPAPAAAPASSK
ncbi:hypothetical protein ACEPAG_1697 [Sanghuangporus baumii]